MKKFKTVKNKILTFALATVLPLSATGIALASTNHAQANANTFNYDGDYVKNEISMTNNNFNSSSSEYSLSSSLSGWSAQVNDKNTTAGIIDVGQNFGSRMESTYRLSNNPGRDGADTKILMINSRTSTSSKQNRAREGYKSSQITLDANSYYSFEVSFKTDTNYNSEDAYVVEGTTAEDKTITPAVFESKNFGDHVEFSYKSKRYYLSKKLTTTGSTLANKVENVSFFYEDDEYVGFMHEDQPIYVAVSNIEDGATENQKDIKAGAETFTCDLKYNATNKNYEVKAGTEYFKTTPEYDSLNDYVYGSMYLSGLKDENGNAVKAEFVEVKTREWTTFFFFVATGNESQKVSLDLWLGSQAKGHESTGVVFYDNCHVHKYSENYFWNLYSQYMDLEYTQTKADGTTTDPQKQTTLADLRTHKTLSLPENNFDFEKGITLDNWKVYAEGTGRAQVFNTKAPEYFKSTTGYNFVGSDLSCKVTIDGETVDIIDNNHVLALWAKDGYVKTTATKSLAVGANEILKITAKYKVSEITAGNAYILVEEDNKVLNTYNLSDKQYSLTQETASSGAKTNGDNEYQNNYSKIEFYVKGSSLYDSAVNLSLSLGKDGESATGCVLFDNITVENVTSKDYESATNKVELNIKSGTTTVPNGNFNKTTVESLDSIVTPQNWTITDGGNLAYNGVINTHSLQYAKYEAKASNDAKNPYVWANYANPMNSKNSTNTPDNVLMLANMAETWQKLTSDAISLDANQTYKLSFKFKTYNLASNTNIKVSLLSDDSFTILETEELKTNGSWNEYEIYLKSFAGKSNVKLVVDFGTAEQKVKGIAYFDNFELNKISSTIFDAKAEAVNGSSDSTAVVDMSDFYLNLPSNNISNILADNKHPAYTASVSSGNANHLFGGIIASSAFGENDPFYTESDENLFFITNQGTGSYTIKSNFNIDMESGKYYVLSFKLRTAFNYANENVNLDDEKTYDYGVTVGLTGYKYMTQLKSDDGYETFYIYYNPSEAVSAQLYMALTSDFAETTGSMAIYDLDFQETDEATYTQINEQINAEDYDVNEGKAFISEKDVEADAEEDPEEEKPEDEEDQTSSNSNSLDWSLLASSLITGLAVVIGVLGYFLSKIKIKKIEKKRQEDYNRKSSLEIDVIKSEARKQRTAEVTALTETRDKFQKELETLEQTHKQKVVELRAADKGQVSKATDKEFKLFAQKRTAIADKLDNLNKQLDNLNSPEYLLSLERKLYAKDQMKKRELRKGVKKSKRK